MNRDRKNRDNRVSEPGKNQYTQIFKRNQGCSRFMIWLWPLVAVIALLWAYGAFNGTGSRTEINYSEFKEQLNAGNVASVHIQNDQIKGELNEPRQARDQEAEQDYDMFSTYLPSMGDDSLLPLLEEQSVEVQAEPEQVFQWSVVILNALPLLILLGVGYLFMRQLSNRGGGNVLSIGKSKAKLYDRRQEGVTFEDVAGAEGAKAELKEIIEFLRESSRFETLGGEIPKGVLLVGPPGTGKTLLARAVAGEAQVPFFNITGSDFMEMFVGVGASRVRDLFDEAKKAAPAIVFIDELDSIGRLRGAGLGGGHDEREQTLNQLLSEMDGFEPNTEVIILAATNRPDILDPALLRPGRFDRRITVDLPTMKDRLDILKIHAANKPLAEEVDLEKVARGTPGFSGADLENLLNEAALLAARREQQAIYEADIENARDKVMLGLERQNLGLTGEECSLLAYHEAGHALLAAVLPEADPIHKVTIVPRGRAMGVTQQLPERDKYLYSRAYLLDNLTMLMGGRAAETLTQDTITSGAESDLKQATNLARKMILDWGMSETLPQVAFGESRQQVFLGDEIAQRRNYSDATAHQIDDEIRKILEDAFERATSMLRQHKDKLDRLAEMLLEHEEISGQDVLEVVNS
jgi:cell division protease FtsH